MLEIDVLISNMSGFELFEHGKLHLKFVYSLCIFSFRIDLVFNVRTLKITFEDTI